MPDSLSLSFSRGEIHPSFFCVILREQKVEREEERTLIGEVYVRGITIRGWIGACAGRVRREHAREVRGDGSVKAGVSAGFVKSVIRWWVEVYGCVCRVI